MATGYDPFSDDVLADPYPSYRRLRDEPSCPYVPARDLWLISRYDDVVSTLRGHDRFSSAEGPGYERGTSIDLISSDPPDHTRLRRIVNRTFLPRVVADLEPRVRTIVNDLLDVMLDARECDLVTELAEPLPMIVIAELLGVPPEHRQDFKRWSTDLVILAGGALDEVEMRRIRASVGEFVAYFKELIADRRAHPPADATDLINLLLAATDAETLSSRELVSFCMLLLSAGNETTTNAIGNGTVALVDQPEQWWTIRDDPSLIPSFTEEALRHDSPVQAIFRTTTADVELGDDIIPAGARVMVIYGSANRDERHYPDPDHFIGTRNPVDHVGFGSGIHYCLGAPLARLEMATTAKALISRVKGLEVTGPVVRTRSPVMRGVKSLPIRIAAR